MSRHKLDNPTLRVLSLGAGVQSTTVLLLACEGVIDPPFDVAIFADTGWEPADVYAHLDKLAAHAAAHGIEVARVSAGNLRDDALDEAHRYASLPLYLLAPDGAHGMGRRQCTGEYKIKPIKREIRRRIGHPWPERVPDDVLVEQAIGISVDEIGRARDSDRRYLYNVFPLLDLGWTRTDCLRYLRVNGWSVAKSACIGCPFHGNRAWRELRDEHPDEWQDAVAFDHAIRKSRTMRAEAYLHASRVPLDEAPIDRVTRGEWHGRQGDLVDELADIEAEQGAERGCSPFTCRDDGA